ncbi:hypothetical protein FOA43_001595 [Brettanomyces nanus]|uniref:SURP motif domain-containing protein n=1 Tax=Eeniella nana TaxID=13502 RepID=A0A875RNX8_EENNA|nr:uncharacterized protein FOA43_001595 [Brettanomyces nanus]QPG74270.1 hypothetical protein FOA43_001595 [Brettanomyces nanus]
MSSSLPVGITVPPPEVRLMIEKTAGYVSRNGASFEQRIKAKEATNYKFQFLLDNDPYNGYYKYVLKEIKDGNFNQVNAAPGGIKVDTATEENDEAADTLKEPPALEFLPDERDLKLAPVDLSAIKLAAQLVAVNEDSFIELLLEFGGKNEMIGTQLQFLNESHSLHKTFVFYLRCYKKILNEKEQIETKFGKFDQVEFLDRCFQRAEYEKKQKTESAKKQGQQEKEMIEYASIDWQDFFVVETVEFTDLDDVAQLETPLNRNELEYRSLIQKKASSLIEEAPPDYEDNQNEAHQYREKSLRPSPHRPTSHRPVPQGIKILAPGESRLKRNHEGNQYDSVTREKLLRCPLTGKLIPESKFARHISILLRDPKYKQEKQRYEAKFRYGTNLVPEQIYENIKSLVDETEDDHDSKKRKVIWNGSDSTISQTKRQAYRNRDYQEEKRSKREREEELNHIGPKRA